MMSAQAGRKATGAHQEEAMRQYHGCDTFLGSSPNLSMAKYTAILRCGGCKDRADTLRGSSDLTVSALKCSVCGISTTTSPSRMSRDDSISIPLPSRAPNSKCVTQAELSF